jgi:hypothetical protein
VFVTTLPEIAAMRHLVTAALLVVGVIHLLPLAGVLGAERLNQLYGIDASEPNLAVLMRHRAVLFGLLGGFFVLAAFKPPLQGLAVLAGFVSVLSFLALAWGAGVNAQLGRVVTADWVALAALVLGAGAWLARRA